MEQAEGNDFNSISSSRNLGHGIYTVIQGDIYCPGTPPSVAAGEAASPSSSVYPAFAYLSCVVQSLPTGFSCCQWWEGLLWISLGDFSPHPARPLGLGPALFLHNTYFAFSKGGPEPPASDHPASSSEMQFSGVCPGIWIPGDSSRKCHFNTCAMYAP